MQDDWKATNRLTLNLGLRWDFRTIPYEQNNQMMWFDDANPLGGLCFADKTLLTTVAPAGNGFYRYCGRRNPVDSSKKPFAPRLGFAYRLTDKTVVRGGYGIFFDASETREIDDSGDVYPFVVRQNYTPTGDPTTPKLTDNMQPPIIPHMVSAATDGSQFFAVQISDHPRNPYVQQWSLSVQRQLAANTTLEANYVGNHGLHLLNRTNINQPFPTPNPALCDVTVGGNPNSPSCLIQPRRPFQNITAANGYLSSEWNGYSYYNAGNLKLEHRTSDLALQAVYTYAKSLDDKSAAAGVGSAGGGFAGHLNDHDPALDYGRSDFDVRHRFVTSYVYSLPLGRGKRFGGSMNRAADILIGGWQVGGVVTMQKGFPFSATGNADFTGNDIFNQRANLVPGCDPNSGPKTLTHWFNTSCFTAPLYTQFGNSGRNILTNPGINNWDMNIGKTFKFTERVAFQFRAGSVQRVQPYPIRIGPYQSQHRTWDKTRCQPTFPAPGRRPSGWLQMPGHRVSFSLVERSSSNQRWVSSINRQASAWRFFIAGHARLFCHCRCTYLPAPVFSEVNCKNDCGSHQCLSQGVCLCLIASKRLRTILRSSATERYAEEGQKALAAGRLATRKRPMRNCASSNPASPKCMPTWA